MQFLNFMNLELGPLLQKKIAKIKLFSLKAVKSLHNLLNSMFLNMSCSFVDENPHIVRIAKNYVFRVFFEILKNRGNNLGHSVGVVNT